MVGLQNRQELFTTTSAEHQARLRDLLEAHEIEYVVRLDLPIATLPQQGGRKYRIFVTPKEVEQARALLARLQPAI
ncbi:MAG: DUF2007 domain-containing protein [Pygmaiobacter massiliensis]|nr:DUF2007 domain-containing protein [Pygmaiobacter massiliensis]